MKTTLFFISYLLFNLSLCSQNAYTANNKGKFFVSWGGNRESYTKSDVTFSGKDYQFTIQNMVADDKPKGWHVDYINPGRMTIPQTNYRMGYFVNDHYSIAIGVDHMKYVMTQNQVANVTGTINSGSEVDGTYDNSPSILSENFLKFEHTDGLNYVNTEFSRHDDISKLFGIEKTDTFQINVTEGIGVGLMYPKTNATLLGKERNDAFHVSGFGTSIKAGLNFTFFKHFYLQTELKAGYINMQDIRTTKSAEDTAKQDFMFLQRIIAFGGIFML